MPLHGVAQSTSLSRRWRISKKKDLKKKEKEVRKEEKKEGKKDEKEVKEKKQKEEEKKEKKKEENKDTNERPKIGEHVHTRSGEFTVIDSIGHGTFGDVFKVIKKDGKSFAMKAERASAKKKVLGQEAKVLERATSSPHFLSIVAKGAIKNRFNYIVMSLVGDNLWSLRMKLPTACFSMTTTLQIAEQTLSALRDLHRIGFLHRDVKPGNVCVGIAGTAQRHLIYLLDFGLSRKYRKPSGEVRLQRETTAFRGTFRYASLSSMLHKEQARKDDLESWLYMGIEAKKGELPWSASRDVDAIIASKEDVKYGELKSTWLVALPPQFGRLFKYVTELKYESVPDYSFMAHNLRSVYRDARLPTDSAPDWDPNAPYEGPEFKDDEEASERRGTGQTRGSTGSASPEKKNE